MKILTLLLVLCALAISDTAAAAKPPVIYQDSGVRVQLLDSACLDAGVLAHVPPQFVPLFDKSAIETFQGVDFSACWALLADGTIYLVDEAGDHGPLSPRGFGVGL